ncbi:MAG: 4Fe-4S binding protein [Alphaproteobacteria bacterium]|nr:4Fe-4S binding protein [Alphaproteobacteria bacterium]
MSNSRRILLCSCNNSMHIDHTLIADSLDREIPEAATDLCRSGLARAEKALAGDAPVLIACTQEAAVFLETAEETGHDADLQFLNIREKAGWSRGQAPATAKMAALLAEALVEQPGYATIEMESEGHVLVLGEDEAALESARRLSERLDVTLVITTDFALAPPAIDAFPIYRGQVAGLVGHLGAFDVNFGNLAMMLPASREVMTFGPGTPQQQKFDLVLDLTRSASLITAPEKRDGYFRVDTNDSVAVADTLFDLADMVGEFSKPEYVRYDAGICAHNRSGIDGCTRCLDICPAGAIIRAGEKVSFDAHVCGGCGMCASVCPTGAAGYQVPTSSTLLTRGRTLLATYGKAGGEKPVLLLHDTRHGEEMITYIGRHFGGLPANVLPFAVNEVTQTGMEFLISAQAWGAAQIALLVPPARVDEAEGLREIAGWVDAVQAGLGYERYGVHLLDEADPEALGARLNDLADKAIAAAKPATFLPLGNKREVLRLGLQMLHEAAPQPVDQIALPDGAPFGSVNIETKGCTLCLSCVSACPVGALSDTPDYPRLSFLENACIQCGLCRQTCPEKVISLETRLRLTPDVMEKRVLHEEEPFACISCGKPYGVRSTIDHMVEKLSGHSMFGDEQALNRLKMCADCRVVDMVQNAPDPMAGVARPLPRSTDEYISGKLTDDEDDPTVH